MQCACASGNIVVFYYALQQNFGLVNFSKYFQRKIDVGNNNFKKVIPNYTGNLIVASMVLTKDIPLSDRHFNSAHPQIDRDLYTLHGRSLYTHDFDISHFVLYLSLYSKYIL